MLSSQLVSYNVNYLFLNHHGDVDVIWHNRLKHTSCPIICSLCSLDGCYVTIAKTCCLYLNAIFSYMNVEKNDGNITLYLFLSTEATVFYPAISTFAVQICYTNKFLLYSY
jgi:hypothetical protein